MRDGVPVDRPHLDGGDQRPQMQCLYPEGGDPADVAGGDGELRPVAEAHMHVRGRPGEARLPFAVVL